MSSPGLTAAPLLPLATAFAAGIAAVQWIAVSPQGLVLAGGGLLVMVAALLALGQERAATTALLLAVAALGALRGTTAPLPAEHIARRLLPPVATIEGRLVEEPVRWAPDRTRLLVEVEALYEAAERREITGRVQLTLYGEPQGALGEGQRIRGEMRLHRPIGFQNPGGFDYPGHLRREGILLVGSARADQVSAITADSPPWRVAVKRWAVATTSARLPETSAALLAGLLLGERTQLPGGTDDAFRRAGVYHVLAVSGFNVALLATSVFTLLSVLAVPRHGTALAAAAVLIGFAAVVGGQPSVLRATVMGLLLLAATLLERESQLTNALAAAALGLLAWRPGDLWEPGFQLSFAATAGIVYLTPGLTAFLGGRGWPSWLATAVAVSLGAQLAVTPLMLAHFNQLSLIGVLANLAVVPLAGAATTLGMLALLLELVSVTLAGLAFDALWLILVGLRAAVWAAASVPGAMIHLPAPAWVALSAWYVALVLASHVAERRWARGLVAGLLAIVVAFGAWPWLRPTQTSLRVTFLDVGQGDATLVELPEGPRVLVDGGPGGPGRFDVGERVLAPFLWNRPVGRLDVVALSHGDADHAEGLTAVLRHFRVGELWESGRRWPGHAATFSQLERAAVPRRSLVAGQRLWVGPALFTVLNPGSAAVGNANDESLVLRLDWRGLALLFTGDLGWQGEARVLERAAPIHALALKVAHHGSRSSSSSPFLEATRPALAIVSVGARNPFRHPTPEALGRLEAAGARVYRTDRDGAILLESNGTQLRVTRWASGVTETFQLDPERGGDSASTDAGVAETPRPPA